MVLKKGKRLLFSVTEPHDVSVVPEIEGWSDTKPESVVDVTIPEGVSESDRRDILVKLEHHKYVFVRGVNKKPKPAAGWSTTALVGCGLCCLVVGRCIDSWCVRPAMELSSFAHVICVAVGLFFLNPKTWCEKVVEIATAEATVSIIAGKLNGTMVSFNYLVEMVVDYGKSWGGDSADNAPPPT